MKKVILAVFSLLTISAASYAQAAKALPVKSTGDRMKTTTPTDKKLKPQAPAEKKEPAKATGTCASRSTTPAAATQLKNDGTHNMKYKETNPKTKN